MSDLIIDGNLNDDDDFQDIINQADASKSSSAWPKNMQKDSAVKGSDDTFDLSGASRQNKEAEKKQLAEQRRASKERKAMFVFGMSSLMGGVNANTFVNAMTGDLSSGLYYPHPNMQQALGQVANQGIAGLQAMMSNPASISNMSPLTGPLRNASNVYQAGLPLVGMLAGAPFGPAGMMVGGAAGAMLGGATGGVFEAMLGTLESIDRGMSDMASELVGLDPSVTIASVERQLAILESQLKRGDEVGNILAAQMEARTGIELALRDLANSVTAEFGDEIITILLAIRDGIKTLDGSITVTKSVIEGAAWASAPGFTTVFRGLTNQLMSAYADETNKLIESQREKEANFKLLSSESVLFDDPRSKYLNRESTGVPGSTYNGDPAGGMGQLFGF